MRLRFNIYLRDQVSRLIVFAKVAAVEGVTVQQALAIAGLLEDS